MDQTGRVISLSFYLYLSLYQLLSSHLNFNHFFLSRSDSAIGDDDDNDDDVDNDDDIDDDHNGDDLKKEGTGLHRK